MTAHQTVELSSLRIEPLKSPDYLVGFDSGEREIDRNIEKCCNWHEAYSRRVACAVLGDTEVACGFYCISIRAPESKYLDEDIVRDGGGFNYIPFVYINFLAVRREYQNNGIGTILLMNALERSAYVVRSIGIYGVAISALSDRVAGLYERYGFRVRGEGRHPFMILPALSVLELFA